MYRPSDTEEGFVKLLLIVCSVDVPFLLRTAFVLMPSHYFEFLECISRNVVAKLDGRQNHGNVDVRLTAAGFDTLRLRECHIL